MNRRAFISLALLSLVAVPTASADLAPPPVVLHIEGQNAALTAAAPDHAEFTLVNVGDEAIEVYLFRVLVLEGNMRTPIPVERVEVGGRASGRSVRVPANGRIRVTTYFALPRNMHGRASYRLDLQVQQGGFGASRSTPAEIRRRTGQGKS